MLAAYEGGVTEIREFKALGEEISVTPKLSSFHSNNIFVQRLLAITILLSLTYVKYNLMFFSVRINIIRIIRFQLMCQKSLYSLKPHTADLGITKYLQKIST